MDWNDIVLQLVQYLVPAIGGLLVALLGYLVAYLSKQTKKVNNELLRAILDGAKDEAHSVAYDAIMATQQKLVDDLKAAAEDGKLTKEEAREALTEAKIYFINHISDNSRQVLVEALGPMKDWLDDFLEAKLGEIKNS